MNASRNILLAAAALLFAVFVVTASAQQGYYAAGYYAASQAQQAAADAENQAAWAAYHRQQRANAQAWATYHAQQAAASHTSPRASPVAAPPAPATGNAQIRFDGRFASVGSSAPAQLQQAVYAANKLQHKPYAPKAAG
jgi:hypothetical protein